VYFSDRLYSEDELPAEFKLFLPVSKTAKKWHVYDWYQLVFTVEYWAFPDRALLLIKLCCICLLR
jgi:hypothetical protein